MYLDPKNPYCMNKDKEKMNVISSLINIIYGDVVEVIKHIDDMMK